MPQHAIEIKDDSANAGGSYGSHTLMVPYPCGHSDGELLLEK